MLISIHATWVHKCVVFKFAEASFAEIHWALCHSSEIAFNLKCIHKIGRTENRSQKLKIKCCTGNARKTLNAVISLRNAIKYWLSGRITVNEPALHQRVNTFVYKQLVFVVCGIQNRVESQSRTNPSTSVTPSAHEIHLASGGHMSRWIHAMRWELNLLRGCSVVEFIAPITMDRRHACILSRAPSSIFFAIWHTEFFARFFSLSYDYKHFIRGLFCQDFRTKT